MADHIEIKADKKRPYKMYAAIIAAFLTSIITSGLEMPDYVKALIVAVLAALAVFVVQNPLVVKKTEPPSAVDEGPVLF